MFRITHKEVHPKQIFIKVNFLLNKIHTYIILLYNNNSKIRLPSRKFLSRL